MSKLNVDQKTIKELFMDRKADFLIPDYQRPYAWEEKECQTLWEDIFAFAFPDDDYSKFDSDIQHKDNWNNAEFEKFLEKNIAFIWAYALTNSGVNALRTPIYAEMINLVENRPVTFSDFKFDKAGLTNILQTYEFSNRRPITKSMSRFHALCCEYPVRKEQAPPQRPLK